MSTSQGKFIWYELMTNDAAAAERFYGDVVGWGARKMEGPGMTYTVLEAGGNGVGGMFALTKQMCDGGARPGWIGYVAVDDVDASAAKVREAGGAVHMGPADIPGIGRFATVADPQGAAFVLFRPNPGDGGQMPAPAYMMKPGHVGWNELRAGDEKTAFGFYEGLLGWTKADAMDMGEWGTYQMFAAGGETLGGMMTKPPSTPGAPHWQFYFTVDGLDAAIARLKAGGGEVVNGPHQVPGGSWIVEGRDPEGVHFALTSAQK